MNRPLLGCCCGVLGFFFVVFGILQVLGAFWGRSLGCWFGFLRVLLHLGSKVFGSEGARGVQGFQGSGFGALVLSCLRFVIDGLGGLLRPRFGFWAFVGSGWRASR